LTRSEASSSCALTVFMTSLIRSSHRFFGRLRGQRPSGLMFIAVLATELSSLRTTWSNHRNLASSILSCIGATPSLFLVSSFMTWSHRVSPKLQRSIFISIVWRVCSCDEKAGQHSDPFHPRRVDQSSDVRPHELSRVQHVSALRLLSALQTS
jgi:hypothetical protein